MTKFCMRIVHNENTYGLIALGLVKKRLVEDVIPCAYRRTLPSFSLRTSTSRPLQFNNLLPIKRIADPRANPYSDCPHCTISN